MLIFYKANRGKVTSGYKMNEDVRVDLSEKVAVLVKT